MRHDDGANLHTLHGADIVLAGVSRTSKTPLSMYLAQRGYKTGNVPLVPGVEPPRQLLDLESAQGVRPGRRRREPRPRCAAPAPRSMHSGPSSQYADAEAIARELDESMRLFRTRGWRVIDVSGRAVEENASRILELVQAFPGAGGGDGVE